MKEEKQHKTIPRVLTIAGSDSGGGAGIQADLKTFSALGCYGMSVITALTAQNTKGVQGVHQIPAAFVGKQLKSVIDDIEIDAVKIGMAGTAETIATIANALRNLREKKKTVPYVLDPVMVSQSGDELLSPDAIEALQKELIPLASVITPNLPEASVLLGKGIESPSEAARALLKLGAKAVLLKGGHADGRMARDILTTSAGTQMFEERRLATENTHGTGCTLAAALACFLARGKPLNTAAKLAKTYVTKAIKHADELDIGAGGGPVHHFYALWKRQEEE